MELELSAENLPQVLRELLGLWRDCVQAKWNIDGSRPSPELARLHTVVHAAAVGTFLDDDNLLQKLHDVSEPYFNDPKVAAKAPQDDTWFHTRARAVDALIDEVGEHVRIAEADGRLALDSPGNLQIVAAELVDIVVARLSNQLELSIEILTGLPRDFADSQHLADAATNAASSIIGKLGQGEAVAPIPLLESIMRGLGHAHASNLTSAARKARAKAGGP